MKQFQDTITPSATWIWYPGDFEIWLGNIMNSRRTERGAFFPPFWKMDSHYVCVEFSKQIELIKSEKINIRVEGRYNVKLDGQLQFGEPSDFILPAGKHKLSIKVWNQATPPAIFVKGRTVVSDSSWLVTNEDKEWIDESGKASDTSASIYMNAGHWNFNSPGNPPSQFHLSVRQVIAKSYKTFDNGTLFDFGKETFGYVRLEDLCGDGVISIYYGESAEEAMDKEHCETLDRVRVVNDEKVIDLSTGEDITDDCNCVFATLRISKAFRYVYVEHDGFTDFASISMYHEYLPEKERGSFKSNDKTVNRMWSIGVRTLQLTTREFFIDGIKRDRWTWSGDATQSYLMNYYLFFDSDTVKRTMWQLRGKNPVTAHINTIMDYTFYWFISIADYYLYTGDSDFVAQIYPRMKTMMDYCLSRTDQDGLVEGLAGDWVFVDWSPEPMDKHGELSFEQVLFARACEAMAACAKVAGEEEDAETFDEKAKWLRQLIVERFWYDDAKALVHNVVDGDTDLTVTRYSNIFAILFDYLSKDRQQTVAHSVLDNPEVMRITTPYMRFYEMEALCRLGRQADVLSEMKAYWGGMLRHGATSFWEAYDAKIDADAGGKAPLSAHLSMYGRPYGKSLCHAWGASPVYLLGKYFLGVRPTKPGYEEWEARPTLAGLEWMEGTVPTPNGEIAIHMDDKHITIRSDEGTGTLILPSGRTVTVEPGKDYDIEL